MATSKTNDDRNSMTQDSDEGQEMHCEQCEKHAAKYETASGLCVDCAEYMCTTCLVYHKRYMPGHKQLNKTYMPQDFCYEKCSNHPDQLIKFYCGICETFACLNCKTGQHQNCRNVAHLPTIVKGIEHSKELQALNEDIDKMCKDLDNTKEQLNSNANFIDDLEAKAKSVITEHKEQLVGTYNKLQQDNIDHFDTKMKEIIESLKKERQEKVETARKKQKQYEDKISRAERGILSSVEETKDEQETKLQTLCQQNKTLTREVQTLKSDIELKQNTRQRCKLFMAMKSANKSKDLLKQKVYAVKASAEMQPYQVESTVTETTTEQLDATKLFFTLEEMHVSNRKKSAAFHFEINSPSFGVSSMCLLSETQLLVADQKKETVLNFKDIKQKKGSFDVVKMASGPADVAKFEETKAVATFPNLGIVVVLYFSSSTMSFIKSEEIRVGRSCYGIACCQKNLVVSFLSPPKIEVFDTSGKVLLTFDTDLENMPLFSIPKYVAISPENTKIYVSDLYRNSITCLAFDGNILSVYKDKQLTDPLKLTVDISGSVYLCGRGSNNVHQLSSDLAKVKILLDSSHGIKEPGSVCCCENMLFVGMSRKGSIKVFQISYE